MPTTVWARRKKRYTWSAVSTFAQAQPMIKRWDTFRIAKWGVLFGIIYSIGRVIYEHGMPSNIDGYVYMLSYIFGGAIGGAALFALVSGARNLILRAK